MVSYELYSFFSSISLFNIGSSLTAHIFSVIVQYGSGLKASWTLNFSTTKPRVGN